MAAQFRLDFNNLKNFAKEDFITSEANLEAFQIINEWPKWPQKFVLITGPEFSGKTHLANIWAVGSGAIFIDEKTKPEAVIENKNYILENLERIQNETCLFHLLNTIKEKNSFLLITSNKEINEIGFKLPDLTSRLKSISSFSIKEPDDFLMKALLVKQFSEKQITVSQEIINFLLSRLERSYKAINQIVDMVDTKALAEKREVTLPFVKTVLETLG